MQCSRTWQKYLNICVVGIKMMFKVGGSSQFVDHRLLPHPHARHSQRYYAKLTLGSQRQRRPRFRPPWRKRNERGATQGGGMDKLGRP